MINFPPAGARGSGGGAGGGGRDPSAEGQPGGIESEIIDPLLQAF